MNKSALYADAYIEMQIWKYLLTKEKIRALMSAEDYLSCLEQLKILGYDVTPQDDDQIITAERQKTLKTFESLSTNGEIARQMNSFFNINVENEKDAVLDRVAEIRNGKLAILPQPRSNPLLWWIVMKHKEFQVVKTILTGKKFGLSNTKIRENIGGLYEDFE